MKDSPLKFERQYQKLKSDFAALPAPDLRLLLLIDFWVTLKEYRDNPAYLSYFDEYLPIVYELITEKNLSDLTIEELQKLYDTISDMSSLSGYHSACGKIVATALAKKYFYVGEAEKALNVLEVVVGRNPASGFDFSELDSLTEFEILQSIYEKSINKNPKLSELLRSILIEWQNELESVASDTINCLFVEKNNTGQNYRGCMRRLQAKNIETFGKNAKNDEITFEDIKVAPKDHFTGVAYDACDAVRKVFRAERQHALAESYYHAHFSIKNGKHTFTGDSIGLAFALLTYTQLLKPEIRRHEKFISSAAAFTGGVDSNGHITPINKETLGQKIDRAFFSPVRFLVIPEANISEAEKILKEKWQSHPRRKLKLIPTETFREVIDDPRVVRSDKVCMLPYITRIVYKYSRATKIQIPILLFLIYLVVCLIFPKAWIWFDWNPQFIKVTETGFVTLNADSTSLWPVDYDCDNIDSASRRLVFDFDRDGSNEITFIPFIGRSVECEIRNCLYLYNWRGEEVFIGNCQILNQYPGDIVLNQHFQIGSLNVVEIDDIPLIITQIYAEDPSRGHIKLWDHKGNSLCWYINAGPARFRFKKDHNRDGNEELLFTGINRRQKCVAFFVLPAHSFYGVSPPYIDSSYDMSNVIPGNQINYILFPPSDLCISSGMPYNMQCRIYPMDDFLKVDVFESADCEAYISYNIDNKYRVAGIRFSDIFISRRDLSVSEKKLPEIDWDIYKNDIFNNVTYWIDSGWVTEKQFRSSAITN